MDNAWYVIYPAHEYDMVSLLGYNAIDVEYPAEGFDRLIVEPDRSAAKKPRDNPKGFYFNVTMPGEQYELKHPEDNTATDPYSVGTLPPTDVDPDDVPAE